MTFFMSRFYLNENEIKLKMQKQCFKIVFFISYIKYLNCAENI